MIEKGLPIEEGGQVSCEVCLKEIPISEAKSAEGSDYVYHFCGQGCYSEWMRQERDEEE